ncbi:MAG: response regulator transcription factor [Dehalococcoidia bacterium]
MGTLGEGKRRCLRDPKKDAASPKGHLEEQGLALESKTISVDKSDLDPGSNDPRTNKSVVILKAQINDIEVFRAIKNGALVLLTQGDAFGVRNNGRTGANAVSLNSFNRPQDGEEEMPVEPISPREAELLEYVAYGNSNKQIAVKLDISEQTVKNHMSSILDKLYANDRTHAVVTALRHRWITI